MILRELNDYYQRLVDDPEVDVPRRYWSNEKAAWEIGLDADGSVAYVDPLLTGEGKGARPFMVLRVPEHPTRSGSGSKPFFLCDSPAYLLGIGEKQGEGKRAAARALHKSILEGVDDEGARAILRFFENDDPLGLLRGDVVAELQRGKSRFAVFRLKGDAQRLHERPAIAKAWMMHCEQPSDDVVVGQCSVTGEAGSLARLFPQVTGVVGAQSAGASLVSFNRRSFDSYGKSQAFNAAISETVAFNAGSALKHLFADPYHRIRSGKTTLVFWADRPAPNEDAVVGALLRMMPDGSEDRSAEDGKAVSRIGYALQRMQQGLPLSGYDPDVRYFILGITLNAARLAVQFFEVSTFGKLEQSFGEYLRDTAMDGVRPRSLFTLLRQTAVRGNEDDVPSPLFASCVHAMLSGARFPRALQGALLTRMRADHASGNTWDMGQRAALIKAYLVREGRWRSREHGIEEKGSLQMGLERARSNRGYVLGRLFAVMERAQTAAIGDVNATIKDRYIGSAASTPRRVYPSLLNNLQHHIAKLRKANAGLCVMLEKETDSIMALIEGEAFPASLDMEDQGEFFVGYYQERCYLWKSKEERADGAAVPEVVVDIEEQ